MEEKEEKKQNKGMKLIQMAGKVIGLLALVFVIKKVLNMDIPWEEISSGKNICWLLLLVLCQAVIMFIGCIPWRCYIQSLSHVKIPYKKVFDVYLKANMMKYLPGNVFHYVARNELALKMNISHKSVAAASVLEIGAQFAMALLWAVCLLGNIAWNYLKQTEMLWTILLLGCVVILFCTVIYLVAKRKGWLKTGWALTKHDLLLAGSATMCYVLVQILGSIQFIVIITKMLENVITLEQIKILMGAYTLAWVVGFITPGAPGGIGVKEGVMLLLTGSMLDEGMIALAMVLSRIIGIAGDVLAYLMSRIFKYKLKNKAS